MAKRPTPKKRLSSDRSKRRHSTYVSLEVRRLKSFSRSPYAAPAEPKNKGGKALKKITRIKA